MPEKTDLLYERFEEQLPPHKLYNSTKWARMLENVQWAVAQAKPLADTLGLSGTGPAKHPLSYEPMKMTSLGKHCYISTAGAGGIYSKILLKSVADLCTEETSSVIDLGSGWGNYIFSCWMTVGVPSEAHFYACEITPNGRKCVSLLSTVEPAIDIKPLYFNYLEPDYSLIPHGQKEIVVYTSHSIEQISVLPKEVFIRLLDIADVVKCVHLEPVGWQIRKGTREYSSINEEHEAYCRDKGYNTNLWKLLQELEQKNYIKLDQVVPDIIGTHFNPASLIRWSKL